MYIPPERDFRPDDGEPYEYDYEPDNTVWRLAGICPLIAILIFLYLLVRVALGGEFAEARDAKRNLTGADFLTACSRPDPAWINFCNGYVQAAIDGLGEPGEDFCPPVGVTRATIVTAVMKVLEETPKLHERNAVDAVYVTMRMAFPCR